MIYIFPIFLFGCTVTGVVFLGIIEAADQLKRAETARNLTKLAQENPKPADDLRGELNQSDIK